MLARREQIPQDAAITAAGRVFDIFFQRVSMISAAIVAGYWPIRGELDDRPILRELSRRGQVCALPHLAGNNAPLDFRFWNEATPMITGKHGIAEPSPDRVVIPDIVLVPLVAFDAHCHRLGYGAGCYDRTLAALKKSRPVLAVGIAYETQRCDDLPTEETDVRMDMIVTDREVYQ